MSSALDKFIAVVKETKPRWDLRAATRCLEAVLARLLPPRQRRSSHSRRRPPNHGIDNDDDRDIGTDRALSRLFVKGISLATLMRPELPGGVYFPGCPGAVPFPKTQVHSLHVIVQLGCSLVMVITATATGFNCPQRLSSEHTLCLVPEIREKFGES
uniref:Uncharacterized protein n=1 Tax=Oryza rufipogon TaxID=4529 RepID=A0A0E0P9S3_ORYRU